MKLFRITRQNHYYDEYNTIVVLAADETEARKLAADSMTEQKEEYADEYLNLDKTSLDEVPMGQASVVFEEFCPG